MSNFKTIALNTCTDDRGNLTFVQGASDTCDFSIERLYYIYAVPEDSVRAGHAHRDIRLLLIAVSGYFQVLLDDGKHSETIVLNDPGIGLFVEPLTWHSLTSFSAGAVCLVLSSGPYEPSEYIRSRDEFLQLTEHLKS